MRAPRPAVLLVALPLALVAVGGPLASAADESSKPAKAILADLAHDLGNVSGYRVTAKVTDADGRTAMTIDVAKSGGFAVSLREGDIAAQMRVLPKAFYLKANAGYWKEVGGKDGAAAARQFANRWVKMARSAGDEYDAVVEQLTPKRMASCVTRNAGTLVKGGTTTIDGKRAIVIVDKGDKPGTTPGRLYVTAARPTLPIRSLQTGKRRPGGKIDSRCEDKDDTSTASDLRFSRFDQPLRLTAPKGAIDLTENGGTAA